MTVNCDLRIFFNLITTAPFNGGADSLLKYYGGEQIYMSLKGETTIASKLHTIGTPLLKRY